METGEHELLDKDGALHHIRVVYICDQLLYKCLLNTCAHFVAV